MRLRLLTVTALLVLAAVLGACGSNDAQDRPAQAEGITGSPGAPEGQYSELGGLKYQVQLSRELNPADPEDRAYLIGLDAGTSTLRPTETWFGVFIRVQYDTKHGPARPTAREFQLSDTQGNVYRPVPLAADNVFAYRPVTLRPTQILPGGDSPAAQNTIQGSLVLFRVPYANFQNRPLVFAITDPENTQQVATQDLDV
jgi:hypothetical protein